MIATGAAWIAAALAMVIAGRAWIARRRRSRDAVRRLVEAAEAQAATEHRRALDAMRANILETLGIGIGVAE